MMPLCAFTAMLRPKGLPGIPDISTAPRGSWNSSVPDRGWVSGLVPAST
jgi:hypothetical protein